MLSYRFIAFFIPRLNFKVGAKSEKKRRMMMILNSDFVEDHVTIKISKESQSCMDTVLD